MPPSGGMNFAVIAQQVERILGKDEVPGSNPGNSSREMPLKILDFQGLFHILVLLSSMLTCKPLRAFATLFDSKMTVIFASIFFAY